MAAKLERIGIHRPADLVFHLPRRYEDRTRITPIRDLVPGQSAVILGRVEGADVRFGRRRSLVVAVGDDSGSILLRFFHFSRSQQQGFRTGAWILCFGEARRGARDLEMAHPEYRLHADQPQASLPDTLTPVYPATEGVGPATLRKLIDQSLAGAADQLQEYLPANVRQEYGLMPIAQAVSVVHHPPADVDTARLYQGIHPAQQRLALEEMLAHHLALSERRRKRNRDRSPPIAETSPAWNRLQAQLGYSLTSAQQRVIGEILSDLATPSPTLRLLQGDVGSGKTVVAAAAALHAIDAGYQVALMAPTELLAEQHRQSFSEWLDPLGITVQRLAGKMPAAARRQALAAIAGGEARLVIGTHALFQAGVDFNALGLVIVDEQHRFGVDQRLALRSKGDLGDQVPHQLIMSATPIPRSLAMILYADLDVSSIDEMPPGRKPVNTVVLPNDRRPEIVERIREVCGQGQQVYWVCPLIDESDKLQAQAATQTCDELQAQLPGLGVALVHGRLKATEKDAVMQGFASGEIDLLVATTVIEVGVNVPNASLMVIENPERLGLAQLHQLRGRVGRGARQSACVLMYQAPLGALARERLGIMRETNDGFKIARKDLELRGPGELLGTRQTGLQQFRIADLSRDREMIPTVEAIGRRILADHPQQVGPLVRRWMTDSEQYLDA